MRSCDPAIWPSASGTRTGGGPRPHTQLCLAGITFCWVPAELRGLLASRQMASALEPEPADARIVDLVAIENTRQLGGSVMPVADDPASHA